MKKLLYLFILLFTFSISIFSLTYAQGTPGGDGPTEETGWVFEKGPAKLLEEIKYNANKKRSEEVQNTPLDYITSKAGCEDL